MNNHENNKDNDIKNGLKEFWKTLPKNIRIFIILVGSICLLSFIVVIFTFKDAVMEALSMEEGIINMDKNIIE